MRLFVRSCATVQVNYYVFLSCYRINAIVLIAVGLTSSSYNSPMTPVCSYSLAELEGRDFLKSISLIPYKVFFNVTFILNASPLVVIISNNYSRDFLLL